MALNLERALIVVLCLVAIAAWVYLPLQLAAAILAGEVMIAWLAISALQGR
jgi:hypothetical protein